MTNKPSLKQRLAENKMVVGTWCEIPSVEVVNILAKAGLDFVIIDMEHGAMDFNLAAKMIISADADDCAPLIRVPKNDESDILRALEIAPQGIIVPHVETVEDRTKVVRYAKYPPFGVRSLNPYTRAGGYRSYKNFTKEQNEKVLTGLIIEGKKGIKNIDKLIDDENVDLVYIGTYDISAMLGIPGDTKNPHVLESLAKLVSVIRKKHKAAGCLFHTPEELRFFKKIGIQFLCFKVDTSVIYDEFKKIIVLSQE